jgi:peptide/nickel transport system substrate-binding protein
VIKAYAAKVGINISLTIESQDAYYGKATFGNSDWLDGTMSLVDYGDRGVPNVFMTAPLTSSGPWNAARFHNTQYDKLVAQYVAALDLQSQRTIAGQIQTLLLNETPIIYPYWIDGLTASIPTVGGLNPTSIAQLYLNNAYMS